MDASKLRNVLVDLSTSNEKSINEKLVELFNSINAYQSDEISKTLLEIKNLFNESIINEYNPSNIKILNEIGAINYFGNTGYKELEEILNTGRYDVQKTTKNLITFTEKRTSLLNLFNTTKDNLKKLNIEAHYYTDDTFEVGILLPEETTKNKISIVTKELNKWDKVFKTLKELNNSSVEDTEIDFVNNGSLEFFINNPPEIALCLSIIIERVVKLYNNIVKIRAARSELEKLGGLPKTEQKVVEKQEKDIFNKEVDKITQDILKDFASKQIESGRANELKIALNGHIKYVAKCIDNGIIIEINSPEIIEPETSVAADTQEEKEKKKVLKNDYDSVLKKIDVVNKAMEMVKTIGKTGIDVAKYLSEGNEGDDKDDDSEKDDQ